MQCLHDGLLLDSQYTRHLLVIMITRHEMSYQRFILPSPLSVLVSQVVEPRVAVGFLRLRVEAVPHKWRRRLAHALQDVGG